MVENTRHNKAWNADAFTCHRRSAGAPKVMQPRVVDLRSLCNFNKRPSESRGLNGFPRAASGRKQWIWIASPVRSFDDTEVLCFLDQGDGSIRQRHDLRATIFGSTRRNRSVLASRSISLVSIPDTSPRRCSVTARPSRGQGCGARPPLRGSSRGPGCYHRGFPQEANVVIF